MHRVDVVLSNGLRIECKHIDGKVYLSWFKRDWKSKGECIYCYKGDLKLSPSITELYHPIVFHYSLLPVYLRYNIRLFGGVTSFLEATDLKVIKLSKDTDLKTTRLSKAIDFETRLSKDTVTSLQHRSSFRGESR
jgi:hypothetical protein